ncbi:hypothetical protein CYLTODRAFT_486196 [Cylindrobasidium torrendii FP15055 ss-10]|uniref:Uncharacterized protein n=1 Tax=Cylindrobasidium torrendii FP15055 ss-10 TaxID=1314674 RepID=A0A0D7BQU6_9AGAR|nr:hypothetical protein CYLTODRAFT_486196 [Cylindrobasidium torrendii FP15055 ss-10]
MNADTINFRNLPIDIGCTILQTAAILEFTNAISWTTTSKAVKRWIEPILYHTVRLTSTAAIEAFAFSISSRKDDSFFASAVKVLSIELAGNEDDTVYDHLPAIFRTCTGISNFVYHGIRIDERTIAYIDSCPRLCRLHLGSCISDLSSLACRPRPHITHLSLAVPEGSECGVKSLLTSLCGLELVVVANNTHILELAERTIRESSTQRRVACGRVMHFDMTILPTDDDRARLTEVVKSTSGAILFLLHSPAYPQPKLEEISASHVLFVNDICKAWGDCLHRPSELDVWQVTERIYAAKRAVVLKKLLQVERLLAQTRETMAAAGWLDEDRLSDKDGVGMENRIAPVRCLLQEAEESVEQLRTNLCA